MTAPSMEEMNKLIVEEVIKETLKEIKLKNGDAALTLFGDHTHLHINPSGYVECHGDLVRRFIRNCGWNFVQTSSSFVHTSSKLRKLRPNFVQIPYIWPRTGSPWLAMGPY